MQEGNQGVTRRGTCPVCGLGCHVEVSARDDMPVRIKKDPHSFHPATCPRSASALDYHDHPGRLNHPMKRAGRRGEGKWQQIPWEQAIDEIAEKLGRVRDAHGPEAVLILGGSVHGASDAAAWRWCNLWGTPNYIHQGKNCGEAEDLAEWSVYGNIGAPGTTPIPGLTKVAIMWGLNAHSSWTKMLWDQFLAAKERGTKLVVVDPRRSESAEKADLWVRLRPGTDGALAYGMLNVIIEEGLYDKDFVERWCEGFDELAARVKSYTPEKVEEITWVPVATILDVARLYATSKPSLLSWGLGNSLLGKATYSAVLGKCFLRAITGNLDVPGGHPFDDMPKQIAFREEMHWDSLFDHPLRKRDNVSAHLWPVASVRGLKLFREAMARVHPEGVGPASYMLYPSATSAWSAILDGDPYPVKAAITQGSNALVAFANSRRIYQAMTSENLELHVVMDHFMTPTAQLADYVMPATDALERVTILPSALWGFGNAYAATAAAADPLYQRRDDYQLWRDLGNRLGQSGYWPDTLEQWFDRLLEPSDVSFEELASRDVNWLFPTPSERRYEETGFATFSGKVELVPSLLEKLGYPPLPDYEEPSWSPVSTPELAEEYPLVMTTGASSRYYYRSHQRMLEKLRRRYPSPLLQIHPETARDLGIAEGDWVWVETPMGRIKEKARLVDWIDPRVVHADALWWFPEQPGEVPSLNGVWDHTINAIIPDDADRNDYAGDHCLRALLCRVYPLQDPK
jgi:anaerobic selenocysteine-containing dehydrogenase